MPGRARVRLIGGLFALAVLASTLVLAWPAAPQPSGFVTRSGDQLFIDGEPFRFTGLNIPNANSDGWCFKAIDMNQVLDDIGPGKAVIRAWFFQGMATDDGPTNTARNWARFDATLAAAAAHDVKVIPVLANQWQDCETGLGYKAADWYTKGHLDGYDVKVDAEATKTYRDWVAEVVDRYKDDPTIAFWQLINEAEANDQKDGACPANASQLLHDWAEDISGLIKSIDANHLVSIGTIGSGQCGAGSSDEYSDLHAIPDVDICEFHDYGAPLVGIPGDSFNGLQNRIDRCDALGKPIFVGEVGIIPNNVDGTLSGRAAAYRAKIDAQFIAGVSGFLAWAYVDEPTFLFNYNIDAGDPALEALAEIPWRLTGLDGFEPGVFVKNSASCLPDGSGIIDYTATHPVAGPMSGSLTTTGVITLGPAGTDDRSPVTAFAGSFTFTETGGAVLTGTLDLAPARQSTPFGSQDFINEAYCSTPFFDGYFQLTARFIADDGTGPSQDGFATITGAFSRSLNPSNFASTTFWVAPEISVQAATQIDESGLRGSANQPPVPEGGLPLTINVWPAPIDDLTIRVFTPNYTAAEGNTDTTEAGSDYTAIDQLIVIPGNTGKESLRTVPVVVSLVDDVDPEILESLTVHVELISGSAVLRSSADTAFIADNDSVTVSIDDVTIAEGDTGAFIDVGVNALAGGPVPSPVYGCIAHDGGTATQGTDYSLSFDPFDSCETSTPLVFGAPLTMFPPASSRLVNVASVFGDNDVEYNETIELSVGWIWGATLLGDGSITLTIVDDEDHDLDADGVDDRIGSGPGGFDDGDGTAGQIVSTGGLDILVDDLPGSAGVRITVPDEGGTASAQVLVCVPPGFTLTLAEGTDVAISCGSVTAAVVEGEVTVELANGTIVVNVPAGAIARIDETASGAISVETLPGSTESVTYTVDGGDPVEVLPGEDPVALNEPPVCSSAVASPLSLWPANHQFQGIAINGVSDPDGDPVTITIDSIFQDEPVDGTEDGNTVPDGRGVGTSTAEVRAERAGDGNGRVFHIGFTATDQRGGRCSGEVTVGVSLSKNSTAVDDGALYDSTGGN